MPTGRLSKSGVAANQGQQEPLRQSEDRDPQYAWFRPMTCPTFSSGAAQWGA